MPDLEGAVAEPVEVPTDGSADIGSGLDGVDDSSSSVEAQASEQQTAEPTAETGELDGDGRSLPPWLRNQINALKEVDPKGAKELRGMWFANQALRTELPGGLQEARKLKEFHAQIGGEEGLQAIEAERSEWAALDEQFSAGDPKFVENIAATDPDAFAKLAPAVIDQLAKINPEQYQHVMSRVVLNTLQSSPLGKAYQALQAANPEAARELADWYGQIEQLAQKQPEKKIDPEREKFEQEKKQWESEKTKTFQDAVATSVGKHLQSGIENALSAEFKRRGMDLAAMKKQDADAFGILMQNCDAAIAKNLSADQVWGKQYKSILASMDRGKAEQFAKQRIDKVLADSVTKVYKAFYTLGGGKATAVQQKTAQQAQRKDPGQGGVPGQRITKPPASREIDYGRTSNEMIGKNQAVLKDGRRVSW